VAKSEALAHSLLLLLLLHLLPLLLVYVW